MQRPNIPNIVFENTLSIEKFQNQTLRPIIKMKDEVLLLMITEALISKNKNYQNLTQPEKILWIKNTITKDIKLNHLLKGIILGNLHTEELYFYQKHQKECSKRMIQIIIERYLDRSNIK